MFEGFNEPLGYSVVRAFKKLGVLDVSQVVDDDDEDPRSDVDVVESAPIGGRPGDRLRLRYVPAHGEPESLRMCLLVTLDELRGLRGGLWSLSSLHGCVDRWWRRRSAGASEDEG